MEKQSGRFRKRSRKEARSAMTPEVTAASYKYCERCEYAPIVPGDRFCSSCGAEFDFGDEEDSANLTSGGSSKGLLKAGAIIVAVLGLYLGLMALPEGSVSTFERNTKQSSLELEQTLDKAERQWNQERCDAGVRSACFELIPRK